MSKGPSQVGTKTTTSIDPLRQEQARFLGGGWQSALNLLEQVPQQAYGGQRVTEWGQPEKIAAYQNMYNTGANASSLGQAALNPYNAATSGQYGVQYSPAFPQLQAIADSTTPGQQQARVAAGQIGQYGQQGYGIGAQAGANLGSVGSTAAGTGTSYGNALQAIGNNAVGLGGGYSNMLVGQASGIPGVVSPAQRQLGFNAATANPNNPAMGLLGQQASGAFLNSNPYLDAMYGSASDAVTRAYQTATAPRTESSYAAAGRYGSPSLGNAVSQNEQNLGKTLGNLGADIYGRSYAAERELQNQATSTLGQQYLSGLGQSSQAAQAAGQLGLGAAEAQQRGYGLGGQLGLQGAQQQGQNYAAGANAALQGLQQQGQNIYQGGSLGLTGASNAADAWRAAGALGLGDTAAQQAGLDTMQRGYQAGNAQALTGAGMGDELIRASLLGPQAQAQAGAGLAGIDQPRLDAAKAYYQESQASPWTNLQNYMNLIGSPTGQSRIEQAPIYGSPLAQGVGMLGAGSQALGGKGGSGGSGYGAGAGVNNYTNDVPFGAYGDYGGGGGGGGGKGAGDYLGSIGKTAMSFLPFIGSDRRLKEDTKVIGNLGALPIHSFRYRGDPVRRFGFMADEVERLDPGAVRTTNLGFKAVDYGRAAASALAREG